MKLIDELSISLLILVLALICTLLFVHIYRTETKERLQPGFNISILMGKGHKK